LPAVFGASSCDAALLDPDHREGAECLLFFLIREVLLGFSQGQPSSVRHRSSPSIQPQFPEDPLALPIDSAIEPEREYLWGRVIQKLVYNRLSSFYYTFGRAIENRSVVRT
jgi:hypothetical protein